MYPYKWIINGATQMKDIIITAKKVKKEIVIILVCFALAFLINIGSIIAFKTPWYEMFTQIGYVIVITLILYFITSFLRLIVYLLKKTTRK